ncbi:hypothetical protein E8E11_001293 [Didymella keratinophila]|nr:hypothetical protein E8E11_001293 [Didymella keratinophila]
MVSPLINYGLGHINGGGLAPWQYMYLVAGSITVLGFDDRERYVAVARMKENNSGVRNKHFKVAQVWESQILVDLQHCFPYDDSSWAWFGYNRLNSLLLTMPAGAVIGTIELAAPYFACKITGIRYTKRSVTSSGMFVGYCLGNFVGPLLFKPQDAPAYDPGFAAVLATSIAAAALAIVYCYVCIWENRRRDKSGTMEGFDNAYDDDLTDVKNPQFRYTL